MNMTYRAREFSSAAECIAHAREVRNRLFNARPAKVFTPVPEQKAAGIVNISRPMWKRFDLHFDAHVKAWEWHLAQRAVSPVKTYVLDRCHKLGADFDRVIGHDRRHDVVFLRQALMFEIREKFGMSFPEIGRIFSGRDHTTVLHAVRRHEMRRAAQ